jgi:hypothetical protein
MDPGVFILMKYRYLFDCAISMLILDWNCDFQTKTFLFKQSNLTKRRMDFCQGSGVLTSPPCWKHKSEIVSLKFVDPDRICECFHY